MTDLERVAIELGERVVDGDLGDPNRVGPLVADRQLDRAGTQDRPLDRQLLNREDRCAPPTPARPER